MNNYEYKTPTPWKYGTGENCREIYDANGALVCKVFDNIEDRFRIVEAVNLIFVKSQEEE